MSAIRYWEILCDGERGVCGEGVDTMDWYLTNLRRYAKRAGWTHVNDDDGGKDYCPWHSTNDCDSHKPEPWEVKAAARVHERP